MRNVVEVSWKIREEFEKKMNESIAICQAKVPNKTIVPFKLIFRQTGRCAGRAHIRDGFITINPDYITNHHDDMLNRTVPHEVAHMVAWQLFNDNGHGMYWKIVMSWLGRPSERCHRYSLEGVKVRQVNKPFKYLCNCQGSTNEHWITLRIHEKIQNSNGRCYYTCRRCRKKLVYYRQVGLTPKIQIPIVTEPPTPTPEPTPSVVLPTPTQPTIQYRLVARFVNGSLVNVKVPIEA